MHIAYISPSILPSGSANSIHVAQMVQALAHSGQDLILFCKRATAEKAGLRRVIEQYYGVELGRTRIVSFFNRWSHADNLLIALLAAAWLIGNRDNTLVVSRNLYASFLFSRLPDRRMVFETHQLESGFRKKLQAAAMRSARTLTVVISRALLELLSAHHGRNPTEAIVLPDAAPAGLKPQTPEERARVRRQIAMAAGGHPSSYLAGYFGQLYSGRGINIIAGMAARQSAVSFLVYGGKDEDVRRYRASNRLANLHFMGHVAPRETASLMAAMDCLLMPYQEKVSIGVPLHDTSRWMSPMKMFEYMATGVPIVASDLPALREVLHDGENCLLAPPQDIEAWSAALARLREAPELGAVLGRKAYSDYETRYTWDLRARKLLSAASALCPSRSS